MAGVHPYSQTQTLPLMSTVNSNHSLIMARSLSALSFSKSAKPTTQSGWSTKTEPAPFDTGLFGAREHVLLKAEQ